MHFIRKIFPLILIFNLSIVTANAEEDNVIEIKVQKGETLSKIAKKYLDDPSRWRELLKYNNVANPNLIYPGQTLKVPGFLRKKSLASVILKLGSSQYRSSGEGNWKEAFVSLKLFRQDQVRTSNRGRLQLKLFNNSILKVQPDSLIQMDEADLKRKSATIGLLKGRTLSIIQKSDNNQPNYTIRTPTTVMAVRGTEFYSSASEEETVMAVYDGIVDVSAQGKTVVVEKGYGTRVEKGKPPMTPFKLIAPPQLISPDQ